MLDIKFIRENPGLIRDAARKKRVDFDVDELLEIDKKRRLVLTQVEALRAQLNAASQAIASMQDEVQKEKSREALHVTKDELAQREKELGAVEEKFTRLMYEVPNIADPSVPDGENREIRRWGSPPEFSFPPKDHITLINELDLADFERGVKVAGFRGYFLKRELARLSMALWLFSLRHIEQKGFVPLLAPTLARGSNFTGTAWFPQGIDDVYRVEEDLFLIGTSGVSGLGLFQDEILSTSELPKKLVAFSPCFRREAGSHGKDTKGLFRLHEFMKVEQVVLSKADHQESVNLHEELTQNTEEIMQALGLHYRVVLNGGPDLGIGQVKKYDIETWIPSQKSYGETHSSSYFHDFQTRRLNIRYRDEAGTLRFAHSLNNTAIATPRILIPFLEQHQREDGSVIIPEVLHEYFGQGEIRRAQSAL